jgi:hypothetical protein
MQTLIAAFDDHRTAQRAVDQLISSGFDPAAVHLQAGYESADPGSPDKRMEAADYESGFSSRVAVFFGNLFGDGDKADAQADYQARAVDHATDHAANHTGARSQGGAQSASSAGREQFGLYAEAVRRGSSVVVVDTLVLSDFDHVERLMYEIGAIDVEDRAIDWQHQGSTGVDAGAAGYRTDGARRQVSTDTGLDVSMDDADALQAGNRSPGRRGVQTVRDRLQSKL